jgi:hypothetical protein
MAADELALDGGLRPVKGVLLRPQLSTKFPVMYATAVVEGKVVRFKLSPALARAHRANLGRNLTEREAVEFVETKRRSRALRRAKPYLESRS